MDLQTAVIEVRRLGKFFAALEKLEEIIVAANVAEGTVKNLEDTYKKIEEGNLTLAKIKDECDQARKQADALIAQQKKREAEAKSAADQFIDDLNKTRAASKEALDRDLALLNEEHKKEAGKLKKQLEDERHNVANAQLQKQALEDTIASLRAKIGAAIA